MSEKNMKISINDVGVSNEFSIKIRIDSLIKKFFDENIIDKKSREQLYSWRSQDTKLSVSNWSKNATYNDLQKKIKFLKQTILQYVKIDHIYKQKLGNLELLRTQKEQKDWDDIKCTIALYDKNFSHGQLRYSTLNLTKDIKDYYQKYKILCKEVRNMKDELNKFTMQYNVDWININSNLINLSNVINNIKNKNTVSLSATRSAEDTLQELRNKLKQTEIVLRDRKKIKENEFFRNIS
ncbi:uncharacterized protein LOC122636977 isoform X1 [Vespula pensylvanica]|uniref:uncharacterized protein LOC122636977 isoform X1 n=1 Tax=Vespula pensylvanica TaxID=30213 RepID=UPI001CBA588E|nr:uncharacterized protein LOC122636977 isoform X1 [Vespula pensylvanica]